MPRLTERMTSDELLRMMLIDYSLKSNNKLMFLCLTSSFWEHFIVRKKEENTNET